MLIFNSIHVIEILLLFNLYQYSVCGVPKPPSSSGSLQCYDENNSPVDWFVMYKLPNMKTHQNNDKIVGDGEGGQRYMYMTSNNFQNGWQIGNRMITDPTSMPGNTLQNLYKSKGKSIWVLYNDQPPEPARVSQSCGHTKGVAAADEKGGFWLVHSVPRFPSTPAGMKYIYPESGFVNGQTFLCLSLGPAEMEKVAIQLQYNQVGKYYDYNDGTLGKLYPELMKVATRTDRRKVKMTKSSNVVELTTLQGNSFTSFAKSKTFGKDLYEDLVAPGLKSNLWVETWRNGKGKLPSDCQSKYQVNNIDALNICDTKQTCLKFESTKDHSKWAISSKNTEWVCIGDINRAESQEKRGGGTVCMNNKSVWSAFKESVNAIEPCALPKKDKKDEIPSVVVV